MMAERAGLRWGKDAQEKLAQVNGGHVFSGFFSCYEVLANIIEFAPYQIRYKPIFHLNRADMKRVSSWAVLLVSLAMVLSACGKAPSPPPPQRPTPEVIVMSAHSDSVPLTREAVGLLAPTRVAQVRARVSGIILSRAYTEGSDVAQGQVLFQIDPAPLKAALHAEEAALVKAQADADNAALIARRYRDLAAKGLLSSQELDTALANERSTAADVGEALAKVEQARLDLEYATVTAPIAGYAGRALVTEGALVGEDEATQLTTIEQVDPIYVNFSQSVSDLQQLQQAATVAPAGETEGSARQVQIMLPDETFYPHAGVLDFSDLAVDSRTGVISLRAVVPNPERQLRPGMFVKLRVSMGKLDHAFVLPQSTVQMDNEGAYVLVVDGSGKVEQRRVQTHGMTRSNWIVSGSLKEGDQVIMDGLQSVSPGAMAKAIPAPTPDTNGAQNGSAAAGSG